MNQREPGRFCGNGILINPESPSFPTWTNRGSGASDSSGIISQKPQKTGGMPLALSRMLIGLITFFSPVGRFAVLKVSEGNSTQSNGSRFLRSNFVEIHLAISGGTPTHSDSNQPVAGAQSTYLAMVITISATSQSAGESGIKIKFKTTLLCPGRTGTTSTSVISVVEYTAPSFVNNNRLVSSRLSFGRSVVLRRTSLKCGCGGIGTKSTQPKKTPITTRTTAQHTAVRCLKCRCLRSKYRATAAIKNPTVRIVNDFHPCAIEAMPIITGAIANNMALTPFIVLVLVPFFNLGSILNFTQHLHPNRLNNQY